MSTMLASALDMRSCRRCKARIALARVWYLEDRPVRRAPTWMPVDVPLENADGNLALHRTGAGQLRARVLRAGEQPMANEVRGMPHFATCAPPALPDNVVPLRGRRPRPRPRLL